MKIAKKSLSLFLSLLMIFTACSVGFTGFTFTAAAATGTAQSVKDALTPSVINQIVYHGHLSTDKYTYKGDPAVLAAAEEVYAYVDSIRPKSNLNTADVNSSAALLAKVAADTGLTTGDGYTALQYLIDPPGTEVTTKANAPTKDNGTHGDLGCDGHTAEYFPMIPGGMNNIIKTVKIYVDVTYLLKDYTSVDAIPDSLNDGVVYQYGHAVNPSVNEREETTGSGCNATTTTYCECSAWNYITATKRTVEKNIVDDILEELEAYEETLDSADLSMTFEQMMELSAAELEAIYNENYPSYQAMIDKYTFANIEKFFDSYNQYFRDLLKAMEVNLAIPAVELLLEKVGTEYNENDYNAMAAIYSPAKAAYNVVKGYDQEIVDYITSKAEYASFDLAVAKSYLDDMKKAMDLLTLPSLKATIENDLAAYEGVNLNSVEISVLKTLLNKLNGYKGTIDAANSIAVSSVMGSTVTNLNNLINAVKANIETRSPAEVESAFNVQYNYFTPVIFGNYSGMATADVITMYEEFDTKLEELTAAYNDLLAKGYSKAVVDTLFSVSINGGSPALIQNIVKKDLIKTELVTRNSAQLKIAAGYKDMASSINLNNYVVVSTAIKNFDQTLYQLCADNAWVGSADQALYADVQAVITAFNNFVNGLNANGFEKVELDENGVYVVRDVYEDDLVKTEAYEVTESKLNDTIVKLDKFLASETFGSLLGLEDADGNAVGLGGYIYNMLGDLLFNNDLINMVVGMLFPMIGDLLETEVGALLAEEVSGGKSPTDPFAVGYADISSLTDIASGGIDVYIGSAKKDGQQKMHQSFASLLKEAGLYVFPSTLADSMVSSGVITTSDSAYIALKAAGDSWKPLGEYDAETDTYSYNLNLDWGITDSASFTTALGGLLDSLGGLLPTLFLNTALDKTLGSNANPAGMGYGSLSAIGIINIDNAEFYASLSLQLQPLNLYAKLIQPLFGALGLEANASLNNNSKGIDYANALLGPIFGLLDKIVANPLDTILGILPNLVYILSTDYIDSFLAGFILDVKLSLGIVGSNGSGFGQLLNALGGLLSFEVMAEQMTIADIAGAPVSLSSLIGANLGNINDLLKFLFEKLEVELDLPEIDQAALLSCATWSAGNGLPKLTADKADLLFFLLDYLMSALDADLINAIIGLIGGEDAEEPSEMITTVLNKVVGSIGNNADDVIAALVELLNPVEYEVDIPMVWAEASEETIAYLNYFTDWEKADAENLVNNADALVASILKIAGSDVESINALLGEKINGLFTNETVTSLVEALAGLGEGLEMAAILEDILAELGLDITAWYHDFGYLFGLEGAVAPEASITGVTASEVDGALVWNGMADGDSAAFVDVLCAVLAPFAPAVEFLFGGEDLGVFDGLLTVKGNDSFDMTLGLLLEVLGIEVDGIDFANDAMGSLNAVLDAVLGWLNELLAAEDMLTKVLELLPDLLYFIESNGLSVIVRNLLVPVFALLDTVRPIVNVDINTVLSALLSDLLAGNGLNANKLIGIVLGTYEGDGESTITVAIDINNITIAALLPLVDAYLGTNLAGSSLASVGLKGLHIADLSAADALTIVLASVIEAIGQNAKEEGKTNGDVIFDLIAEKTGNEDIDEIVNAVLDLISGTAFAEYKNPNWTYMYEEDTVPADGKLPVRAESDVFLKYTEYDNNWNQATADELNVALEAIVDGVLAIVMGEDADLGMLLEDLIAGNLYTDDILNSIVEMVTGLISDYEAIVAAAGALLNAEGLLEWEVKDWGIDAAETVEAKKEAFVNGFVEVLKPAYRILDWLLFGNDLTFFDGDKKTALITISGGEGYNTALVPLFEALGIEMKKADEFANMEEAVRFVFTALTDWLYNVCRGLDEGNTIVTDVFNLIPNLLYFVNADGLKVVVNNLLVPVVAITDKLAPLGLEVDFGTLIENIDITSLDFNEIFKILEAQVGIVIPENIKTFISNFYIGKLEAFESANGETAYRMVYTEEETRIDLVTVLISIVAEVFTAEENKDLVVDLVGEDIYTILSAYLKGEAVSVEKQDFSWLYTDKADGGEIFSPVEAEDSRYDYVYGDLYTREKAEYINKWLPEFIDTTITLIGYQNAEGENVENLGELLQDLVGTSIYTTDLLNTILDALKGLVGTLKDALGDDELFTQVAKILNASLGVDVALWDSYEVTEITTGDRDAFVTELTNILAPVNSILAWLLTNKPLAFFNDANGDDIVVIEGAEGYAYGIIPLLEALGCDQDDILTPAEYAEDADALLLNILNPLLNRVDALLADPVNELVGMLPGLIYFINSNGLDTVFKNTLMAVFSVLENIKPLAEVDLYELMGIDLSKVVDMETLISMILDLAAGDSEFVTIPMDVVSELTLGTVRSFTSKNGETAYTMDYAPGGDQTDLVTTILRLVLEFVAIPENAATIEALLADNLSEEGYLFLSSLLENFSQMAATEDGMDAILYTVYQIFYTANVAIKETEDFLGEKNDDYTFLGKLFATSDLDFIKNIGASLGGLLDNFYDGDIIGSTGIAQNGLMKFFQAIMDFFQKIVDFFMGLFA